MKWVVAIILLLLTSIAANAAGPIISMSGGSIPPPPTVEVPGPSAALFAAPYYVCNTNRYVNNNAGAGGSDSNDGTTSTSGGGHGPWLTLQHANDTISNGSGGWCINVVASATAYDGTTLTKSGTTASSSGYITYRCTTLDGCTINGTAGDNGNASFWSLATEAPSNYIFIDGFIMAGVPNSDFGAGVDIAGACCGAINTFGSHHIWTINSIISGFGLSGIQINSSDYIYAYHNKITNSVNGSSCDAGAQGSAISDAVPLDIATTATGGHPGYVPTADDQSNPTFGSFVNGPSFFHKVFAWNVLGNNELVGCPSGSATDGNGFIQDSAGAGNFEVYLDQSLVAFNIIYNNSGGGIHIFGGGGTVVANNSCYNPFLDTTNTGTARGCIDAFASSGDEYFNNITTSIPAASGPLSANSSVLDTNQASNEVAYTTTLGSAITTTSQTNLTMVSNDFWQAGGNSAWVTGTFPIQIDSEVILVTTPGSPTTSLTAVTRGYLGTTAATHLNGAGVQWLANTWTNNISKQLGANAPGAAGEINLCCDNAFYSATLNKENTSPAWVDVGNTSAGNLTTPPNGANFALQAGSPAIGYGLTKPYLSAQSVDAGACYHTLSTCP